MLTTVWEAIGNIIMRLRGNEAGDVIRNDRLKMLEDDVATLKRKIEKRAYALGADE